MGRIVLLDELTANKIAAGEVVERPASVVKELVENSIDAGSTRIEISITDGGLECIIVSDNGSGMDSEDAWKAFERHATSKITRAQDLERIGSLGFRGEALPSISAVSRLTLRTRTVDALSGTEIFMEGGTVRSNKETGCPAGTRIEVRDLFYNTPARKKYLKAPTTEAGHVSDIINKLAMGYPDIAFLLKHNDRVILQTSGSGNLLDCIVGVYGAETAREMLPIKLEDSFALVKGYIGKPSLSRSGRNHQTVYINRRYVKSRTVSEAVERAYHGMMMTGRHPVFVLKVEVNPEEVDVNVHPAKTEIRIAKETLLEGIVSSAVSHGLAGGSLIPSATPLRKEKDVPANRIPEFRQEEFKAAYSLISADSSVYEKKEEDGYTAILPETTWKTDEAGTGEAEKEETETGKVVTGQSAVEPRQSNTETNGDTFPELKPIGQIECTYIVAQGPDGMYLIDQHAAHERVLFEKYINRPEEHTASFQLLFPVTLELTHQEGLLINDNIMVLTDLGFVVEHFGGDTFLLRAVPAGISKRGGKEIFLDLLDYFSRNRCTISTKALKETCLITMACRNAIKANDRLGLPEMESLLSQLAHTGNPYTCPHGRPTVVHFPAYELEKRFKRVL